MDLFINILWMLAGFTLLIIGGDKLVDGASGIARRFKMSEMFIGIAIIGFGTSMPELMATVSAMRADSPEIALGNIVGSNIANMGLILGVAMLLASGATGLRKNQRDYVFMVIALLVFSGLFMLDMLNFTGGVLLIVSLLIYLFLSLKSAQGASVEVDAVGENISMMKAGILLVVGFIGLMLGANWLVSSASSVALTFGISERIIGITIIAVGSSLPELAAAIAAAKQGKLGLTAGNILGSNTFNVFAAGGASMMVDTLPTAGFGIDMLVMLGFMLLVAPIFFLQQRPYKLIGSALLLAYIGYIAVFVI